MPGEGHCGDGLREGSKECDDGNANNADDCLNDCVLATCGDGVLHENEGCDEGEENGPAPALCGPNCRIDEGWMDGVVDPGEQRDDANGDYNSIARTRLEACDDGQHHQRRRLRQ